MIISLATIKMDMCSTPTTHSIFLRCLLKILTQITVPLRVKHLGLNMNKAFYEKR